MLLSEDQNAVLSRVYGAAVTLKMQEASVAMQVATVDEVDTPSHSYRKPFVSKDVAAEWVAEGADFTVSDPTVTEILSKYYKLGALTSISNELVEDSLVRPDSSAVDIVTASIMRDMTKKLDKAFFGSRAEHETTCIEGLEDVKGVNQIEVSGGLTNLDCFTKARFACENASARLTSFVAHPDDAETIAQLKESAKSNRTLVTPDATKAMTPLIDGLPLYVTDAVTKGTIWGIPGAYVNLAIRKGIEVNINEGYYFGKDKVALRGVGRFASLFTYPEAIQKISIAG